MLDKDKNDISTIDDRYKEGSGNYGPVDGSGVNYPDGDPGNEANKLGASEQSPQSKPWDVNMSEGVDQPAGDAEGNFITRMSGKKKATLFGVGGLVLLLGLFFGLLAPGSLMMAIAGAFSGSQDTTAPSFERRFTGKLRHLFKNSGSDAMCAVPTSARCHGSTLNNKALRALDKKGIKIVLDDGSAEGKPYDPKDKRGRPKSPIKGFYDDAGKLIKPEEVGNYMKDSHKNSSRFIGSKGAWNMRYKTFSGKYKNTKFFKKLGLSKRASLVKDLSKKAFNDPRDRLKGVKDAIKSKIPGLEKAEAIKNDFTEKINKRFGRAAKAGGLIYLSAVAGCVIAKIPSAFAAAAAGYEMLRMANLVHEFMSAGDLSKASGMYAGEEGEQFKFSPEAAEALGAALTAKDKNGKSATDSKFFLAAMGINTSPTGISEEFAPGYSIITDPTIVAGQKVEKAVDGACGYILSPAAMWAAASVSMALNGVGLLNIAGGFVLSKATEGIVNKLAEWGLERALEVALETDKLENLEGEELGDALGVAAKTYFSGNGLTSNIPALSQEGVQEFAVIHQESLADERSRDIASHSPFDISSTNTLLGSIVNRARLAMVRNGGLSDNLLVRLGAFARISTSFTSLAMSSVGASSQTATMDCGYAKQFNLEITNESGEVDPALTPAINSAGLPCTGFTKDQISMSSEMATEALVERGWIKGLGSSEEEVELAEDATTEEFLDAVIVKNTLLHDIYESCSNMIDGSHLTDIAGCMAQKDFNIGTASDPEGAADQINYSQGEDGEYTVVADQEDTIEAEHRPAIKSGDKMYSDTQAVNAIPVFLVDVQLERMINGHDDNEQTGGSGGSSAVAGDVVQTAVAFSWPDAATSEIKPTPAYAEAISKYGISGMDCGRFVLAVLRSSGVDPDFPVSSTGGYDGVPGYSEYMMSSDKYTKITANSMSDLRPGDILNSASVGHIKIYIGKDAATDGGGEWAEASLDDNYGHRGWPGNDSDATVYDVFRLK